jgi:large subunit ribosomal protein L19
MKSAVITSPVNMKARTDLGLRAGDTVRVWQNIVEIKQGKAANKKEVTTKTARKQAFEGLVLSVKHGTEAGSTFTVRRVASGVGVEKTFPLYSPVIDSIEVLRRAKTRRAKLYFIRDKASRDQKRAMRKSMQMSLTTVVADVPEVATGPADLVPSADVEPVEAQVPTVADLTNEVPEVTAE